MINNQHQLTVLVPIEGALLQISVSEVPHNSSNYRSGAVSSQKEVAVMNLIMTNMTAGESLENRETSEGTKPQK